MDANTKRQGMAITSLVLGILSVMCLGLFAGIPAIILGHTAHRRTRNAPDQYAGRGLAITGFVLGYASILLTALVVLIFAARVAPQMAPARSQAQRIKCINNMKNIGLAFRIWAADHQDRFPFQASANQSGQPGEAGRHEFGADLPDSGQGVSTPTILVCPSDPSKRPAKSFASLQLANVTYEVETGPEVKGTNPGEVLGPLPDSRDRASLRRQCPLGAAIGRLRACRCLTKRSFTGSPWPAQRLAGFPKVFSLENPSQFSASLSRWCRSMRDMKSLSRLIGYARVSSNGSSRSA